MKVESRKTVGTQVRSQHSIAGSGDSFVIEVAMMIICQGVRITMPRDLARLGNKSAK